MKIAVTGKGGTGKTTIAAFIARTWAEKGCRTLAIDADPDSDLPFVLGFNPETVPRISEMRALIKERTGATGSFFRLAPEVDDILEKYSVSRGNLRLLALGAIQEADKGCACPENSFLKSLIRHIVLEESQRLVVDFEAGIEHLGRGAASGIDVMLIVVEPTATAVNSYRRIKKLAGELGIGRVIAVWNKVKDEDDRRFLSGNLQNEEKAIEIPFSAEILDASRKYQNNIPLPQLWESLVERLESFQGL